MKNLLSIALLFLLTACGPSLNQLIGEQEYYKARVAIAKQTNAQPVFEMVSGDPTKPIVLENVSAIRTSA